MMGNYHVQFLGGKEAEKPLPYPVLTGKTRDRAYIKFYKLIKSKF